jgi:hypothetical protein
VLEKVLWIEDAGLSDFDRQASYVIFKNKYDLKVALNATQGLTNILQEYFDAIIIDIRIPPGTGAEWIDIYNKSGANEIRAKLGLHLLNTILDVPAAKIKLANIPLWVNSKIIGVLTIEPNLYDDMNSLGINNYIVKPAEPPDNMLHDIIDRVISFSKRE